MFKRKARTTHQPAYTGVNNAPLPSNAPNNNARAAALAIGNTNKPVAKHTGITRSPSMQYNIVTRPPANSAKAKRTSSTTSHQPHPHSATTTSGHGHVTRTGSGLSPPTTQYQSSGSLLKRGSVVSGSSDDFHNFAGNTGAAGPTLVNTADDSFTDSYFEEVNDINRRELHDLRLQHLSLKTSGGAQAKKSVNGHAGGGPPPAKTVKMVKKYVPTPNGIKIIEVPETTIQKEMARSNSMRTGMNVSRAGSLTLRKSSQNSLNSKIPRSGSLGSVGSATGRGAAPSSRLSSLVKQAPHLLPAMAEQKGLEGATDSQEKEYHDLQQQIEHEKKLAHDLAVRKKEYEQLKALRLQNQRDLEVLREELTSPVDSSSEQHSADLKLNTDVRDPLLTDSVDKYEHHAENNNINKTATSASLEYTLNATLDPKSLHSDGGHPSSTDETLQASSSDNAHLFINESPFASRDQLDEIKVVEQYDGDGVKGENVLDVPDITFDTSSYEDLDNDTEHGHHDNDHELKPTFQDSPEVIEEPLTSHFSNDDSIVDDEQHLGAPPHLVPETSSTHSLTSAESYESPHRTKKPMKSAMKSSSSLNKGGKDSQFAQAKQTAAHEAYLSLTTAENTRLNSKLSANQLSPVKGGGMAVSPSATPKRMPLSLRKSQVIAQQQQQQQQHMVKSLRPQSTSNMNHNNNININNNINNNINHNNNVNNNALGYRTSLRKQPPQHTYVQPMPPHPALVPNYKSPSKIRAAELYEKANLRPMSVQLPLERKSSFSKQVPEKAERPMSMQGSPNRKGSNNQTRNTSQATVEQPPVVRQHRTTLRDSRAPTGPLPVQYGSRLNDSDDEGGAPYKSSGFSSRFHDSDDDLPPRVAAPKHEVQDISFESKTSKATGGGKEKKKFGKLRKLFGKH